VPLVVTRVYPDGAVPVPALECVRLLLGLAVRPVELEHSGRPVRQLGPQNVPRRPGHVRLADSQPPLLGALGDEIVDGRAPVRDLYRGAGHR
jgi:hypothetical protein